MGELGLAWGGGVGVGGLGPKIAPLLTLVHTFPSTTFAPKSSISMIWSSKSVLPSQNFDAHLFHVVKKTRFSLSLMVLMI